MKTEGDRSQDTTYDADALGLVYLSAGQPARARPLLEKALQIRLTKSHPAPLLVSQSYCHLGMLDNAEGRLHEAQAEVERSLNTLHSALPVDNDAVAQDYDVLGQILLAEGRVGDAQGAFTSALRIAEHDFGDTPHPLTADARRGLNLCLKAGSATRSKLTATESDQVAH